jgi:hypothetical protein
MSTRDDTMARTKATLGNGARLSDYLSASLLVRVSNLAFCRIGLTNGEFEALA